MSFIQFKWDTKLTSDPVLQFRPNLCNFVTFGKQMFNGFRLFYKSYIDYQLFDLFYT